MEEGGDDSLSQLQQQATNDPQAAVEMTELDLNDDKKEKGQRRKKTPVSHLSSSITNREENVNVFPGRDVTSSSGRKEKG